MEFAPLECTPTGDGATLCVGNGHRGQEMPKVLQGLIYAVVIGLAGLGLRLVYMHYALETIHDATMKFAEQQQAQAQQLQRDLQVREQQRQQAALVVAEQRRQAMQLAPDERCIGGTVVRVNGNSYTQVAGAGARPAACAGRQRLDLQ